MPTVEDKVAQMALKKILEAIYETDFLDVSYGFRPKRNCHQALKAVDEAIMTNPTNYVADMDIEKYFDTVVHSKLKEVLGERIAAPSIISLIGRFLKAGIMEEGKYYETDKGLHISEFSSPQISLNTLITSKRNASALEIP